MDKNLIDYIDSNPNLMIDWVHEFFEGKYSKDEVNHYLYGMENSNTPRNGVVELSKQFNNLKDKNVEAIRNWYSETDFYVFDLLPWNGSGMFKEKADTIINLINSNQYKSVVDFGGGLGVLSSYITMNTDCQVTYVDLKDGTTFKFAQFLFNKLGLDIKTIGDKDFFESNMSVNCIVATDCFEHIPNMEETFKKLTHHTNTIYHDSTFFSDGWSPQHVYTPRYIDFLNMCASHNFLPDQQNQRVLNKVTIQFAETGALILKKV